MRIHGSGQADHAHIMLVFASCFAQGGRSSSEVLQKYNLANLSLRVSE